MKVYLHYLVPVLALLAIGCNNNEREKQLSSREQALFEKEKNFAAREADYKALLHMRDSLTALQQDTSTYKVWPGDLQGLWNSRTICTESNCADYIIGDQRNDTWEFGTDSIQLYVKVFNTNNLIRTYTASFSDNYLSLKYKTDSSSKKQVEMNVLFSEIGINKLKGSRTVIIDNKCTAKFSVELDRIKP